MVKAISLFSGGLDSVLAAKLVSMQKVEVIALYVDIGFSPLGKKAHLELMAKQAGATLKIVDAKQEYLDKVLFHPKFGYGKNFNPCIDCHGFMLSLAKSMMPQFGASFLISGEVIGQRPMSQNKLALQSVVNISETKDILLRPLCAKLMEPTLPERKGWVDRTKLLAISGRGRAKQLQLAKELGIAEYESPAGGCLLTDVGFSNRLREFIAYDTLRVEDIDILKVGRHMRLPHGAKLIVGRNKEDNQKIKEIKNPKYLQVTQDAIGPLSLLQKDANSEDRKLAAKIIATYSKHQGGDVGVQIAGEKIYATPFQSKEMILPYLIQ